MRTLFLCATGIALLAGCLTAGCGRAFAASSEAPEIKVQGTRPQLMFACELDADKLQALFADPAVTADLKELNAGLSLALVDMSSERAQVVRRLNEAGIPVVAWMALPKEQGYYLNADNAGAAAARFAEFEKWTGENGLRWAGIGLDIEPSLGDWTTIQQGRKWRLVRTLVGRAFDGKRVLQARAAYAALIGQMQSRGYMVQTYQLLFLADERRAHSTVLERLFGVVDVRGDDEVLMVYSSFNHALDAALVWGYGPDAHTIAVGSTASAGSPQLDAKFGPLNWDEFFARSDCGQSFFARGGRLQPGRMCAPGILAALEDSGLDTAGHAVVCNGREGPQVSATSTDHSLGCVA
jgi:hypothetical protein